MISLEKKKRRGIPPGTLKTAPLFPEKIKTIVKMRDSGVKLREIAKIMGMTSAGARHLYLRWATWAREQK